MGNRRRVGALYEEKAAAYLEERGYKILERNYRCQKGEIDLIALDGDVLVFLEVKYRSTEKMGDPAEAVNASKQRKICRVADDYRRTRRIGGQTPCRFDVVAILGGDLKLYRNAFLYRL